MVRFIAGMLVSAVKKAKYKRVKRKMLGGFLSVFAALGSSVPRGIMAHVDNIWAHAELTIPPSDYIRLSVPAMAAYALVMGAGAEDDPKAAAICLSAAQFCISDVVDSFGKEDQELMGISATVAKASGLEFYSHLADEEWLADRASKASGA